MVKGSLRNEETNTSRSRPDDENYDPRDNLSEFHCILRCRRDSCDLVRVVGDSSLYPGPEGTYYDGLDPRFFWPALPLVEIHDQCPEPVMKRIHAASKIIWVDPSSAANRLRSAIEALMDDQGIPRGTAKANGKANEIALHERIDRFKKAKPGFVDVADLLLAVKWIGNVGSHDDRLQIRDVIDGVEILDFALEELYDPSPQKITQKAADITARKGIPMEFKSFL